ncbi:hypothetical protein Taro_014427 [Colocasia esculenta]|uniref:Uncharacterized protein n=1 Tax=Colocasia esculenta TaxID=4460 RepID=A0A843UJ43_COLES|nr:hypothetical protein [Colocasia esculenta]
MRALVLCELRGSFLQVLGLFEFIAYLNGLNSNPSGSSDPWVAVRPSGSLAGGPGGRVVIVISELRGSMRFVRSFPARSSCELQESLLILLGVHATSVVVWFARTTVGFVIGLRIRMEVRFPQNGVVLVSGFCCIALWVEVHRLVACVLFYWLDYCVQSACLPWVKASLRCVFFMCLCLRLEALVAV